MKVMNVNFFIETIGNAYDEVIRRYVRGRLKGMDAQEEKWKQHRLL
jgi:hypothetical protein